MYVQKGFISNTTFANNAPGMVAQLGELSPSSFTFSRQKGFYSDNVNAKNLLLTTFVSKRDGSAVVVPSPISNQILQVANLVYNQTLGGQVDIDPLTLLETLLTNFTGQAENFQSGSIISDGTHALPEWVSWKSDVDPANPDNFIKIWFVDQSFQQQYDEYEIYVVPPFDVLDNFFQSGDHVETMLYAFNSEEKTARLQAAKGTYPETVVRTNTFMYFDPVNPQHQVPSDWGILIYGPAGDNLDSIKDTLMDYILSRSQYTRDEWTEILPDIFKRTEFILLPLWDQYAIPNRVLETGIYSPQVHISSILNQMQLYANQYPSSHVNAHTLVMGHPYRSLAIASIGSPDNRSGLFELTDLFADLISVTSTSIDFNRMSRITQDWATMIASMLVEAEKMTDFTTPPPGMMKVRRNGILYLTKSYKNVNYLVVAKNNFILPPPPV